MDETGAVWTPEYALARVTPKYTDLLRASDRDWMDTHWAIGDEFYTVGYVPVLLPCGMEPFNTVVDIMPHPNAGWPRPGKGHNVPGPDGHRPFGGLAVYPTSLIPLTGEQLWQFLADPEQFVAMLDVTPM